MVVTKDGYDQFRSLTTPVEQDSVKLDIKMNKPKIGLTRLAGLNRVDTALEIASKLWKCLSKEIVWTIKFFIKLYL